MADTTGRRPWGRTLSDFGEPNGVGLRPAERHLLDCARTGKPCVIASERPKTASDANTIRPSFLRFLALGGDAAAPVHENGIQLFGAYIDGPLDLNHCDVPVPLLLASCYIDGPLQVQHATTRRINLQGSHIAGLEGDGLTAQGDLMLRNGFKATGEVRLLGADIGGPLDCTNGTFENPEGNALHADGVKTSGEVFLTDDFHATGEVRLLDANIGGNLACNKGTFENPKGNALHADRLKTTGGVFLSDDFHATGQVRLLGADIGGDLSCRNGTFLHTSPSQADASRCAEALDLQNATVHGACFLDPKQIVGSIDLGFARVGVLADNSKRLPPPTCKTKDGTVLTCHVVLDGFTYDRIGSNSSTKAKDRRRWLERQPKQDLTEDFKPQPYEQLAKVLREMGHARDAQDILLAKRQREFRNEADRLPRPLRWLHPHVHFHPLLQWFGWFLNRLLHLPALLIYFAWAWLKYVAVEWLIGHGYRVHRAVIAALGLWLVSMLVFYQAAEQGVMVPSDPRVFLADDLQASCAGGNWTAEVAAWRVEAGTGAKAPHPADACDAPRMHTEHTTLHPALYALDVILPLAPLGQESTWVPSVDRDFVLSIFGLRIGWAWLPMVVMWFNIGFGWIVGLLIAAVVSGVVKRE